MEDEHKLLQFRFEFFFFLTTLIYMVFGGFVCFFSLDIDRCFIDFAISDTKERHEHNSLFFLWQHFLPK